MTRTDRILRILKELLEDRIINGADYDVIWLVDVEDALKRGITDEELLELANLNWHIEDECFACFV